MNTILMTLALSLAPAQDGASKYTRIIEPNEGAFSFLLPAGWKSEGGLVRDKLALGLRMQATSPDGKVRIGTNTLFPMFIAPGLGTFPVGTVYDSGFGFPVEVQPYTPAFDFLTKVILPRNVGAFRVTRRIDRPDLTAAALRLPGTVAAHAVEVEYRFQRDGEEYVGVALCHTGASNFGGTVLWAVHFIHGFEAPVARIEEGRQARAFADATMFFSPVWLKAQAQGVADRGGIINDLIASLERTRAAAYKDRNDRLDTMFYRFDRDAIRGTVDLYDTNTGRVISNHANNARYYFVDVRGEVVGNETGTSPGLEYRPLQILPLMPSR